MALVLCNKAIFSIILISTVLLIHLCFVTTFSLEEYCSYFTSDIRPIVCVLKDFSTSTQSPHWNNTNSTGWLWEDDCSCELWCWPKSNQTDILNDNRHFDIHEWFYNCNSCGSECPINQSSEERHTRPSCSCALIGSSRKSTCSCTATCATFRGLLFHKQKHFHQHHHFHRPRPWGPPPYHHHHHNHEDYDDDDDDDDDESSNCIFTVNNVFDGFIVGNRSRELSCECGRSKRAEWNMMPDFVCICQQT